MKEKTIILSLVLLICVCSCRDIIFNKSQNRIEFYFLSVELPINWKATVFENELHLTKSKSVIVFTRTSFDEFDSNEMKSLPTKNRTRKEAIQARVLVDEVKLPPLEERTTQLELLKKNDTINNTKRFVRILRTDLNEINVRAKFQNFETRTKIFAYGVRLNESIKEDVVSIFNSVKFSKN